MSNESMISLPNNRRLHYASTGNQNSKVVILFFSGILSIGSATSTSIPPSLDHLDPHYIAPTIPGNGQSSSTPSNTPYHINLCESITQLLEHLHPSDNHRHNAIEHLFIGGGSYGTVMAQMLYGAPFDLFPLGRKVRGLLLLSPFSPFRQHIDYAKNMIWSNWLSVGPISQLVPFRLLARLFAFILQRTCRDDDGARKLLDMASFSRMDAAEQASFKKYAETQRHMSAEALKEEMARNTLRCSESWDGFIEVSDVLHSDWGFGISDLDEEHARSDRSVLIVQGESDPLGMDMAWWLAEKYSVAELRVLPGGHLSSLYHMNEIWEQMITLSGLKV